MNYYSPKACYNGCTNRFDCLQTCWAKNAGLEKGFSGAFPKVEKGESVVDSIELTEETGSHVTIPSSIGQTGTWDGPASFCWVFEPNFSASLL